MIRCFVLYKVLKKDSLSEKHFGTTEEAMDWIAKNRRDYHYISDPIEG